MGATAMLAAGPGAAEETYKGYEQPSYTVLWREGDVELRDYAPHMAAEVLVRGSRREAANAGFRTLAGYIFGGNATREKISMTVPVAQAPHGEGIWSVRFMVPAEQARGALPEPDSAEIRFVDVPGGRQLVLRFAGLFRQDAMPGRLARLKAVAAARGLATGDVPRLYFYDDPLTRGRFRSPRR